MKTLVLFTSLLLLVACDPYGFGFKKNPAYVIQEVAEALKNGDEIAFVEVSGKEALCLYGNEKGMDYLNENLNFQYEDVELDPKLAQASSTQVPTFTGFWSYHHERYEIDVNDKADKEVIVRAIIDCEYGTNGAKDQKYYHQKAKKQKRKECKLVKIVPVKFAALPISPKCERLKINL